MSAGITRLLWGRHGQRRVTAGYPFVRPGARVGSTRREDDIMIGSSVWFRRALLCGLLALAAGCAPNAGIDDGATGSDATSRGDSAGSASFNCCLNGSFYACPSTAAAIACAGGFDVGGCHAACAPSDFACQINCDQRAAMARPDPSQCTRTATGDSTCSSSGTDGGSTSCGNASTSRSCAGDSDCGYTNHCFEGQCYSNGSGSPCSSTSQCGYTGHCHATCCYQNASGSPCSSDDECGYSSTCVTGECN